MDHSTLRSLTRDLQDGTKTKEEFIEEILADYMEQFEIEAITAAPSPAPVAPEIGPLDLSGLYPVPTVTPSGGLNQPLTPEMMALQMLLNRKGLLPASGAPGPSQFTPPYTPGTTISPPSTGLACRPGLAHGLPDSPNPYPLLADYTAPMIQNLSAASRNAQWLQCSPGSVLNAPGPANFSPVDLSTLPFSSSPLNLTYSSSSYQYGSKFTSSGAPSGDGSIVGAQDVALGAQYPVLGFQNLALGAQNQAKHRTNKLNEIREAVRSRAFNSALNSANLTTLHKQAREYVNGLAMYTDPNFQNFIPTRLFSPKNQEIPQTVKIETASPRLIYSAVCQRSGGQWIRLRDSNSPAYWEWVRRAEEVDSELLEQIKRGYITGDPEPCKRNRRGKRGGVLEDGSEQPDKKSNGVLKDLEEELAQ